MMVSVFVRRLKPGRTFDEFIAEWEADRGFGLPTRVVNAQSLDDPRDVLTVGFVDITVAELEQALASVAAQEQVRHDRIETVIESTALRSMYELRAEHDFTSVPVAIEPGSAESLLAVLATGERG
jgi:hypothetical protein